MPEFYPKNIEEMANCANWPYIYWQESFTTDLREWLNENVKGQWWHTGTSGYVGCSIIFENEEDAMAFKLRWL